jgi:hypothetical protein
MFLKKAAAVLFLIVGILSNLTAHEGGHYHSGDGTVFNIWRLQNGEQVLGNFSAFDHTRIILERENGKLISLPIESFSKQDQRLLQSKIKQTEAINRSPIFSTPATESGYYFTPIPLLLFLLVLGILFILKKMGSEIQWVSSHYMRRSYWIAGMLVLIFSCKKSADSTNTVTTPGTSIVVPKTSTGFMDSVFAAFKPSVSTNFDNTYYYVSASGFPNHNMMIGITSWQQQVPIPQNYTGTNSWSIPLQPVMATTPLSTKSNLMKGAVALAVNGIPIFNALNNRGEDSYKIGELDNWGGHCGKADDYHYHAAPLHLATVSGKLPIAYALDGFPVYGDKEPDGTAATTLDTCHGHSWNTNQYHYHGTTTYPYVVGAMRGKVTLDPSTPAPENQILPQAFAKPARPSTNPLNGAAITNFVSTGTNAYLLTYKIGAKFGYVAYSWDASNKFTYTLTDTSGQSSTNSYQR